MKESWVAYLQNCLPMDLIDKCVIYCDKESYWKTRGITEALEIEEKKVKLTTVDDLDEDDLIEIIQSFASFSEETLLAGIFSENIPSIDIINSIFSPLKPPLNYLGYSLITVQSFPSHLYRTFLEYDYNDAENRLDWLKSQLKPDETIHLRTEKGSNLEFEIGTELVSFPFKVDLSGNKHVLFPSLETVSSIKSNTLNGQLVVDITISAYYDNGELIDPFGAVDSPITLILQNGNIISVEGNTRYCNDLEMILEEEEGIWLNNFGLGLGPKLNPTGIGHVDRMIGDTCHFGNTISHLDFIINNPKFSYE